MFQCLRTSVSPKGRGGGGCTLVGRNTIVKKKLFFLIVLVLLLPYILLKKGLSFYISFHIIILPVPDSGPTQQGYLYSYKKYINTIFRKVTIFPFLSEGQNTYLTSFLSHLCFHLLFPCFQQHGGGNGNVAWSVLPCPLSRSSYVLFPSVGI